MRVTVNVLKFWTIVACQMAFTNSADSDQKKQSDQGLPCLLFWHWMNSSPDNQHFIWKHKDKSVWNLKKKIPWFNVLLLQSVWQSSRWLFLLMFGLPTAVISVVCYSLCCMETIDDEIQSDEDSDDEVETTAQLIGLYDSVIYPFACWRYKRCTGIVVETTTQLIGLYDSVMSIFLEV